MPIIISGSTGQTTISGSGMEVSGSGGEVTYGSGSIQDAIAQGSLEVSGSLIITGSLIVSGSNTITNYGAFTSNAAGGDFDFRVATSGNENTLFVDGGTNRVGIGAAVPARALEIEDPTSAAFQLNALNARGAGNDNTYSFISDAYGFSIFDDTTGGTPGYRFNIADGGGTTTRGYVGIGNGAGVGGSTFPTAQLHVSGTSPDGAAFRVDGAFANPALFITGSGQVGIGTITPATTLDILGDTLGDQLRLGHGGSYYYKMGRNSAGFLEFRGNQTNFVGYEFKNTLGRTALYVSSSLTPGDDRIGIGTATPAYPLTVAGSASFSSSAPEGNDIYFGSGNARRMGAFPDEHGDFLMIAHEQGEISLSSSTGVEVTAMNEEGGFSLIGSQMNVFVDDSEDGAISFTIDPTTGNVHTTGSVGIGLPAAATAKVSLDIHYTGSGNPINLDDDKGGGEVVYFGTASANLTAGGVYYLNAAGGWESANSANTGSGHNQLLGIAMGGQPEQHGVLIKGFFHEDSYFSGSFIKGGPIYIQSSSVGRGPTEGGYVSGAAPNAADSYVRVIGYGTDTPNVIYFNPDATYVEIG